MTIPQICPLYICISHLSLTLIPLLRSPLSWLPIAAIFSSVQFRPGQLSCLKIENSGFRYSLLSHCDILSQSAKISLRNLDQKRFDNQIQIQIQVTRSNIVQIFCCRKWRDRKRRWEWWGWRKQQRKQLHTSSTTGNINTSILIQPSNITQHKYTNVLV